MTSHSSSSASKSRRELFEEQLQDLQRDITNLSSKLAVPSIVTSARLSSSANQSAILDSSISSSVLPAENLKPSSMGHLPDLSVSMGVASQFGVSSQYGVSTQYGTGVSNASREVDFRAQLDQAREELRRALRDKDDALRKTDQLKKEIEELQKATADIAKFKLTADTLKQENDALKLSLESSERLRVQQKELITMLHKTHTLTGEAASVASYNSISSISHRGEIESVQPMQAQLQNSSAQENRNWLNMTHGAPTPRAAPPAAHIAASKVKVKRADGPAAGKTPSRSTRSPVSDQQHHHASRRATTPTPSKTKRPASVGNGRSKTPPPVTPNYLDRTQHSFSDILATNPSLISQSSILGYQPEWMNRPSFAFLQGVGGLPSAIPPPTQSESANAWMSQLLPAYPGASNPNPSDMLGRPPLYPSPAIQVRPVTSGSVPTVPTSSWQPAQSHNAGAPQANQSSSFGGHGSSKKKASAGASATKKTATTPSKETKKRPSSAPTSSRVLVRPVASPPSTFSKATRALGR